MTYRLAAGAAAASAAVTIYELVAWRTRRAPTITRITHTVRVHFRPQCPTCGHPLVPRPPDSYRGYLP